MTGAARFRRLLSPVLLCCLIAASATAQVAERVGVQSLLIVDRERMVAQSEAARDLRRIEIDLREKVQAQLDRVKAALEAEEKELTRLRDEMPKEEFETRSRDFDRRVRIERRTAQERGAALQKFISEAQAALLSAADPVLQDLRREKGAALLIDAGAAVAFDPAIDVTDEAIARFDEAVSEVTFTPPDELGLE